MVCFVSELAIERDRVASRSKHIRNYGVTKNKENLRRNRKGTSNITVEKADEKRGECWDLAHCQTILLQEERRDLSVFAIQKYYTIVEIYLPYSSWVNDTLIT